MVKGAKRLLQICHACNSFDNSAVAMVTASEYAVIDYFGPEWTDKLRKCDAKYSCEQRGRVRVISIDLRSFCVIGDLCRQVGGVQRGRPYLMTGLMVSMKSRYLRNDTYQCWRIINTD